MDFASPLRTLCPLLAGPENYLTWRSKIEMILIREKLWSIVCERRTKPETGAKAQSDFEEDAERATATMFLYLSETAERYVRDLRDPVIVWSKLKEVFGKVGFTARYNLWKKLFVFESGYAEKPVEYLDKVRSIGIALRETGAVVPDEILVTAALQGLSEKFDALVAVVVHKEEPTFDSLTALLIEESARKGVLIGKHVEEKVFIAGERKPGHCWHCGKPGHKKDRCFELHPELKDSKVGTGPLPTPGGRGGLSEQSMAAEAVW